MGTKAAGSRAGELAEVKRGFDHWRRSRQRGRQIPEPLWRMAVNAAISHGVGRTFSESGLPCRRKPASRPLKGYRLGAVCRSIGAEESIATTL